MCPDLTRDAISSTEIHTRIHVDTGRYSILYEIRKLGINPGIYLPGVLIYLPVPNTGISQLLNSIKNTSDSSHSAGK